MAKEERNGNGDNRNRILLAAEKTVQAVGIQKAGFLNLLCGSQKLERMEIVRGVLSHYLLADARKFDGFQELLSDLEEVGAGAGQAEEILEYVIRCLCDLCVSERGCHAPIRTGDKVRYISDVHGSLTGREASVDAFDLDSRMIRLRFPGDHTMWCFFDEIRGETDDSQLCPL